MGELRRRMEEDMELKGFSPRTRSCYLSHVQNFVRHHGRSPDQLGCEEVRGYLHYLIHDKQVSRSTMAQAYSALKFFYGTTLHRGREIAGCPVILNGAMKAVSRPERIKPFSGSPGSGINSPNTGGGSGMLGVTSRS